MTNKNYVFVYGTLKRGFGAHNHYLGEQTFVGTATSTRKWWLLDNGGFPVVLDGNEAFLRGEIYEVSDGIVKALDAYEGGRGNMYDRADHEFLLENGEVIVAQMYTGVEDFWKARVNRLGAIPIPEGSDTYGWREKQEQ